MLTFYALLLAIKCVFCYTLPMKTIENKQTINLQNMSRKELETEYINKTKIAGQRLRSQA